MTYKLKIKDSIYVLKGLNDNYVFIFTGTRRVKEFQVNQLVKDTISYLESEITEQDLVGSLSSKYKEEDIHRCLRALENEGVVRRFDEDSITGRYSRQINFIDELTRSQEETLALQRRIEKSKIAVFGVGGIGTWIINGLYQIGVGEIRIADPDIVAETNLNRQILFDSRDIGHYKVDVVKEDPDDL